uniref:Uncharacterized protein n=1 Tax=Rangifer tarandus platyrhynchus TaxID=3082113 RepID=A0ACB0F6J8_RANTA|nr:unnamed protein product [Rangifer tarandus platyrhynchus]
MHGDKYTASWNCDERAEKQTESRLSHSTASNKLYFSKGSGTSGNSWPSGLGSSSRIIQDAPASARAAVQAGGQRDGGMPAASDVPGHRAAPPLQEAAGGTRASGAPGPAPEPRAPAPAPRSRPARWGKPKTPRRPPPAPFRIDARQPKRAGASPDGGS